MPGLTAAPLIRGKVGNYENADFSCWSRIQIIITYKNFNEEEFEFRVLGWGRVPRGRGRNYFKRDFLFSPKMHISIIYKKNKETGFEFQVGMLCVAGKLSNYYYRSHHFRTITVHSFLWTYASDFFENSFIRPLVRV